MTSCLHVFVCVCVYMCMSLCMYVLCVNVWDRVCVCMFSCTCVCMYVWMHVYACVCVSFSSEELTPDFVSFSSYSIDCQILDLWGWVWFFFFLKAKSNLKLCCEYREWGFQNVGCLCCWGFKNCLDSKWKERLKSWALFSPTGAPGCCTVAGPLTRGLGSQRPLWQEGSGRKVRPYWATAMCQALYIHYGSWLRSFLE